MYFENETKHIKSELKRIFSCIETVMVEEKYMGGHYLKVIAYIGDKDTYLADRLASDLTIEDAVQGLAKELDLYIEVEVKKSYFGYTPLELSRLMLAC